MGKYLANSKVLLVIYVLFIKQEKVFSMHKAGMGRGAYLSLLCPRKWAVQGVCFLF